MRTTAQESVRSIVRCTFAVMTLAMFTGCVPHSSCSFADLGDPQPGVVTVRGESVTLVSFRPRPDVGDKAPDFTAVKADMSDSSLSQYTGGTVVLLSVPSLDTPVCDLEARTFAERLSQLPGEKTLLVISMDLPFAQKRWCAANGLDTVVTLSDSKLHDFACRYGLRIRETGLLARAVFVIDRHGTIVYRQIVPEVTDQPDFDAAIAAAAQAASRT